MKPQHLRSWISAIELVTRDVGPQISRRAKFCDLLKEIAMRVPEEGDTGRYFVERQAGLARRAQISLGVRERKGNLFDGSRTGFPNMIARYGDRIPLWYVVRTIVHDIRDQPH
jgi:hypothetical protein